MFDHGTLAQSGSTALRALFNLITGYAMVVS